MAATNQLPLAGQRIVVTRAGEQAGELIHQLKQLGAEVLLLAAVSFCEPEETGALDQAIRSLETFDWVVFTSQNAVRFFCQRCRELGVDCQTLFAAKLRVAVVGPATAGAAKEEGLRVDRVASQYRGEALAKELHREVVGKRVLLPRSDRARGDLPAALRAAGAEVVAVVAYRTRLANSPDAAVLDRIRRAEVDVLTFASPSAFDHFAATIGPETLRKLGEHALFAAIGPVTAAAMRAAGVKVEIEARESTAAGLVMALKKYFAQRTPSGVSLP